MAKRKTVTKKEILEAIKKEPLKAGSWVKMDDFGDPVKDKNCTVCAIGAVLRRAKYSNQQAWEFGGCLMNSDAVAPLDEECVDLGVEKNLVERLLSEKKYLHALSVRFEGQALRTGVGKRTRKILTDFVKKNLPDQVKLITNFESQE